jgi:acyl-CoA thioester hydrolase
MPMRFDLPPHKKLVFEMTIPIRWGDMDAMGHVNNTLYFRYLEILRIEWFRSLGCVPDQVAVGPIIINAFCTFLRQLEYPGELHARHYIGEIGRSTVDTYVTLERTDQPGVLYATGGATVIWTDFKAQKALPLPDWVRERLIP